MISRVDSGVLRISTELSTFMVDIFPVHGLEAAGASGILGCADLHIAACRKDYGPKMRERPRK